MWAVSSVFSYPSLQEGRTGGRKGGREVGREGRRENQREVVTKLSSRADSLTG